METQPQKLKNKFIRYYSADAFTNKSENLGKTDNFLGKYRLPNLSPLELEILLWRSTKLTSMEDIEKFIKELPYKKAPGSDGFILEFYQIFKKDSSSVLHVV